MVKLACRTFTPLGVAHALSRARVKMPSATAYAHACVHSLCYSGLLSSRYVCCPLFFRSTCLRCLSCFADFACTRSCGAVLSERALQTVA